MRRLPRTCALACALATVTSGLLAVPTAAFSAPVERLAQAAIAVQGDDTGPGLPREVPAAFTPWVNDDSAVRAFAQVGDSMIAAGKFESVSDPGGSPTYGRTHVVAFDATTGAIRTGFDPVLDGQVESLLPGPTPGTVYVAGGFTTVNGSNFSHLVLLDVATGTPVPGFRPAATNGVINSIDTAGGRLFLGGTFTRAGGVDHAGFATLDATTGALDPYMNLQVAENHNNTGSGAQAAVGVRKLDITPAGDRLVAVGNYRTVDGLPRDQVVMVTLGDTAASVTPDWNTNRYNPYCFNWAYDSIMRDMSLSPDGSYLVIGATGGHNAGTLCDTAARFETYASGTELQPTWANDSGGDTLWGIGVTDSAVYVGGHQRWMNNPYGSDYADQGAVPRPGMAALDPETGVPLDWNPGRNPRGVSAFAMYATPDGLWMGSDTLWVGNRQYRRPRIAFFPYEGGRPTASTALGDLPGDVVVAGGQGSGGVLYRVNAGGGQVLAADSGPDWAADDQATSPFRTGGSNAAGWDANRTLDATVPAGTPAAIFDSERWDPNGGDEMEWGFPVAAGEQVQVRLYFANRCSCTQGAGQRAFDVYLDGDLVQDDLDLAGSVGHNIGTMRAFDVTSDGTIDIDLGHVVENPLINGIEIVRQGTTPGTVESVQASVFDGSTATSTRQLATPGLDWSTVRGAVMIGGRVFYGSNDGFLYRRSFDGEAFGPAVQINPYNDPRWADVDSGSNSTFNGRVPDLYGKLDRVTGMFYTQGRLFYTLNNDGTLYWQLFSPDSGIVDPVLRQTSGSFDWARARGMFVAEDSLYVASSIDGSLSRIALTEDGFPTGPPTVVSSPVTGGPAWNGRAVFLSTVPPVLPNQAPTASFDHECDFLSCGFDGAASSDAEGSVLDHAWEFGDGATGSGPSPSHDYAQPGTFDVTLTVTDDAGGTDTLTRAVTVEEPPNVGPEASFTESCLGLECAFDGASSSDPEGAVASYAWEFGDGTQATGIAPSHTFTDDGSYDVTLTVTDGDGATDAVTREVEVSEAAADISYVDGSAATSNLVTHSATIPAGTQAGDRLLVFLTVNKAAVAVQDPAGPWTAIGEETVKTMTTRVWTSIAAADAAGQTVSISLDSRSKATIALAVYRGASQALPPVLTGAADGATSDTRTTPVVSAPAGSWVVSAWADKSATTTSWAAPADGTVRLQSYGTDAGHTSVLLVDSGSPVASGPSGGLVATSNEASGMATIFSVALPPSDGTLPPNVEPVADFTQSCLGLECTFDGAGSSDSDGSVVSHTWDLDGHDAGGTSVTHEFAAAGTYEVSLTVTDDRGGVDTLTRAVTVAEAADTSFVGQTAVSRNVQIHEVVVPEQTQAGDRLVLFLSANRSAATFQAPSGAGTWDEIGSQAVKTLSSRVWSTVAGPGAAGQSVSVALDATTKATMQLVVYRGVSGTAVVAGAADPAVTAQRASPTVTAPSGSLLVTYWADKSTDTTSWQTPGAVTLRGQSAGSLAGHTSSVVADSGSPVAGGPYGGLVATSDAPSPMAVSFTLALAP